MSSKRLKHYLISIPLPGGYIHGYVMTNREERDILERVTDRLINEAESIGLKCWPPMALWTHLSSGVGIVRDVINKSQGDEPAKHWKTVKDFHMTGWFMRDNHPDAKRLMELH